MAIPDTDLARIERWCAAQWPERFHHEVFCEHHVRGTSVTLCETRTPWNGEGGWTHQGYAQLRYRGATSDWALYWADRNSRWHVYEPDDVPAIGTCAELLAAVDADVWSIFKG